MVGKLVIYFDKIIFYQLQFYTSLFYYANLFILYILINYFSAMAILYLL